MNATAVGSRSRSQDAQVATPAAPPAKKFSRKPSTVIDQRISIDALAEPEIPPVSDVTGNVPSTVWGTRPRQHRESLISLCNTSLARRSFPDEARKTALRINRMLSEAKQVTHSFRGDVGPAFLSLIKGEGELPASQILNELSKLYRQVLPATASVRTEATRRVNTLARNAAKSAGAESEDEKSKRLEAESKAADLDLPEDIIDVPFENRHIHLLANKLERAGRRCAAVLDQQEVRHAGLSLLFISSALNDLAPPRVKAPANECALCYRHAVERLICAKHRSEEGRYLTPTIQRERFSNVLKREAGVMGKRVKEKSALFRDLLTSERETRLTVADLRKAFEAIFPIEPMADTPTLWDEVMAQFTGKKSAESAPINIRDFAKAWYTHPTIDDPDGIVRLDQPLSSVLFKLLHDVGRYEAYHASGGEVVRRQRVMLSAPEQIAQVLQLRREGNSLGKLSEITGASITQIRRILSENEQAGMEDSTEAAVEEPVAKRSYKSLSKPAELKRVVSLRQKGGTLMGIAETMGVSAGQIRRILNDHGVS